VTSSRGARRGRGRAGVAVRRVVAAHGVVDVELLQPKHDVAAAHGVIEVAYSCASNNDLRAS
jgi:hypothetical protein